MRLPSAWHVVCISGLEKSIFVRFFRHDMYNECMYVCQEDGLYFLKPPGTVARRVERFGAVTAIGLDSRGRLYVGADRKLMRLTAAGDVQLRSIENKSVSVKTDTTDMLRINNPALLTWKCTIFWIRAAEICYTIAGRQTDYRKPTFEVSIEITQFVNRGYLTNKYHFLGIFSNTILFFRTQYRIISHFIVN